MEEGPGTELEVARATGARGAWQVALDATRRSLVTRLKDHADQEGWQRFFDTYGGAIRGLACKSGLTDSEADDALQETLVSVAREMPGFRYDPAKGSFKGWLFQIARRRIVDQFRRRERVRREGEAPSEALETVPAGAGESMERAWDEEWRLNRLACAAEAVKAAVSARQWQMFDLAVLKRWPTERICATLGINRAQLYMAKMRVGRLLRSEVARLRQDD